MNTYKLNDFAELVKSNSYVGRGILVGKSEDGENAVSAYFIMGRSENSRNRIFAMENGELFTKPFDESKVSDPSLIIYAAVRQFENKLIVTNGDQTDTIFDSLKNGHCMRHALMRRTFEPDSPNYTPRISACLNFKRDDFDYELSILKSVDENGTAPCRFFFSYPALAGVGHFIHTYLCNGSPIPSFIGEPERVKIENDIDAFSKKIWNALDANNKISLWVRYTNLKTKEKKEVIINKNTEEKNG